VSVLVSETAALGNFTITLLGISATATHTVSLQVVVTKGPIQALYFGLPVVAVVVILTGMIFQRRRKRSRRRATVEEMLRASIADEGYVATARVIARLEELRASNQVDESTYQRFKKEYEKRLAKSK
jgi:membrane protein implicated in regulation of membrane protease activity